MIITSTILAALSLGVIGFIVYKHYHQLIVLDVGPVQTSEEKNTKTRILKQRAQKEAEIQDQKFYQKIVEPLLGKFSFIQKEFRKYVRNVQHKVDVEKGVEDAPDVVKKVVKRTKVSKTTKKQKDIVVDDSKKEEVHEDVVEEKNKITATCRDLLKQARSAFDREAYVEAENTCIAIIKKKHDFVDAYQVLADVYAAQGQLQESIQTYEYLLRLNPTHEHAMIRLSELWEEKDDIDKAVFYLQEAVLINDNVAGRFGKLYDLLVQTEQFGTALEAAHQAVYLEPENPHYLDNLLEVSIIVGDQKLAKKIFARLEEVNPENNKLGAFKARIAKMEEVG